MTPTENRDGPAEPTLGALAHDLSIQIPELVRSAGLKQDVETVKGHH